MVIDTSALLAILREEPESDAFIDVIANHPDPIISAATLVEARIVVEARFGPDGSESLNELINAGGIRVVAFDEAQSIEAHRAWRDFGRGNSPARLNLGDCFSYALAKETGRTLLFKGDDFTKTDIDPAA
ncbi:MAG: type II toxin-antitoxin system VapC family toxin [Solirubrobacterales bacterium]|nr:type II toxin-antitoxin system VapC family toxin [Solirubrobacterales bacterium]